MKRLPGGAAIRSALRIKPDARGNYAGFRVALTLKPSAEPWTPERPHTRRADQARKARRELRLLRRVQETSDDACGMDGEISPVMPLRRGSQQPDSYSSAMVSFKTRLRAA
jgi:hypothetical protein